MKVLICLMSFGGVLYSYLAEQNDLTRLRMKVPELRVQLSAVVEENMRLKFQAETFENPSHLMQLASRHEYSHLKHPCTQAVLSVESYLAVHKDEPVKQWGLASSQTLQPTIVLGAK